MKFQKTEMVELKSIVMDDDTLKETMNAAVKTSV